ncbi:guanylate kinase [Phreatobacter aquaticus]|uniref:Guanylate kinase n=1 Tax=Phreatobacter aquaticus TaxID=2570229 RepID=A0A4D7QP03_9HYPH|nr:guanylate kinase [Phreatobacter aquaticus]QCK87014.1 guanylate kinase [Phreatobacter aquaticus]
MADPVTARRGLMLVLTSPSGAGKSTLTRQLLQTETEIALSVSVTTRPKRADEIDKVHYFFISPERFIQMRDAGELLEWAEVHGNFYGTPKAAVEQALSAGNDVLFDIDVAGVRQLSAMVREDMATIFLLPPSVAEQISRLKRRASDEDQQILKRLKTARTEIEAWSDFDYILVNDDLDRAFMELRAILHAERLKQRRRPKLDALITELGRDLDRVLENGDLGLLARK